MTAGPRFRRAGPRPTDPSDAGLEPWRRREAAEHEPAEEQGAGDLRFARTMVAAAERSRRQEGAAESWDRMALPDEVREALGHGRRPAERLRRLLRRLTRSHRQASGRPPRVAPPPTAPPDLPSPMSPPPPGERSPPDVVDQPIGRAAARPVRPLTDSLHDPIRAMPRETPGLRLRPAAASCPAAADAPPLAPAAAEHQAEALPPGPLRVRPAYDDAEEIRTGQFAGPLAASSAPAAGRGRLGRLGRHAFLLGGIALMVLALISVPSVPDRVEGWWARLVSSLTLPDQLESWWAQLGGSGSAAETVDRGAATEALAIAELAGDGEHSLAAVLAAIERAPGRWDLLYELGRQLQLRGNFPAALLVYREAAAANPEHAAIAYELGHLLQLQGNDAEATEQYRRVVRLDPHHALAFYNLGVLLERAGAVSAALDHYRRAVALSTDLQLGAKARARIAQLQENPPPGG